MSDKHSQRLISHNVSKIKAFEFFFGTGKRLMEPSHHFVLLNQSESPPMRTLVLKNISDVKNFTGSNPTHLKLKTHKFPLTSPSIDECYSPDFLNRIRCDVFPGLSHFNPPASIQSLNSSKINVIAHFRAGDLLSDQSVQSRKNSRIQSLDSYLSTFEAIQALYPTARLRVLSSTMHIDVEFDNMLTREFESRGIEVQMDSEFGEVEVVTNRTLRSFALLAQADILIMAKSSFSHVAGLYNPNCVVYEEYNGPFELVWNNYFPRRWIGLKNNTFGHENADYLRQMLPLCMQARPQSFCIEDGGRRSVKSYHAAMRAAKDSSKFEKPGVR